MVPHSFPVMNPGPTLTLTLILICVVHKNINYLFADISICLFLILHSGVLVFGTVELFVGGYHGGYYYTSMWSLLPFGGWSGPYPNPNPDTDLCGLQGICYILTDILQIYLYLVLYSKRFCGPCGPLPFSGY